MSNWLWFLAGFLVGLPVILMWGEMPLGVVAGGVFRLRRSLKPCVSADEVLAEIEADSKRIIARMNVTCSERLNNTTAACEEQMRRTADYCEEMVAKAREEAEAIHQGGGDGD